MRFLADETCDFGVVRALRAEGHDVAAVAEGLGGLEDPDVIGLAVREGRLLIAEDKDFGRRFRATGSATAGVLFLRFPAGSRARLPKTVAEVVRRRGEELLGRFVVVQPGRIRVGRLPAG